jgi:hypothetical protein
MYIGTEEVPDDVIWNVVPLRRKYANKFERGDADTLCTQQYTLYIVGTFRHVLINHLQPVIETSFQLKRQQDEKCETYVASSESESPSLSMRTRPP